MELLKALEQFMNKIREGNHFKQSVARGKTPYTITSGDVVAYFPDISPAVVPSTKKFATLNTAIMPPLFIIPHANMIPLNTQPSQTSSKFPGKGVKLGTED
jgi:hypothetical protein